MNPVMGTINPAKGIEARESTLSDAELKMLWPHLRPLFRLLLLTGCRRDELGDLRWTEVDLDTGIMTIPGSRTKTSRELILTLPPTAVDILKTIPRHERRVPSSRYRESTPIMFGRQTRRRSCKLCSPKRA
jgi:integrase